MKWNSGRQSWQQNLYPLSHFAGSQENIFSDWFLKWIHKDKENANAFDNWEIPQMWELHLCLASEWGSVPRVGLGGLDSNSVPLPPPHPLYMKFWLLDETRENWPWSCCSRIPILEEGSNYLQPWASAGHLGWIPLSRPFALFSLC